MTAVAYVAVAAVLNTGGVLLLRNAVADMDLSAKAMRALLARPSFYAGFALYASSFLTWLLALRRYEVVVIFPAFVGAGYAGVVLGGYFILGESLTVSRIAGIVIILVGVFVVAAR